MAVLKELDPYSKITAKNAIRIFYSTIEASCLLTILFTLLKFSADGLPEKFYCFEDQAIRKYRKLNSECFKMTFIASAINNSLILHI
jgi:hypothetical protein